MIKDSGKRREFETGAVRDVADGKGRCDLLPLDVIGHWLEDDVLRHLDSFIETGDDDYLFEFLDALIAEEFRAEYALELAKHFEKGAKKYEDRNWQRGIPVSSYIDSAVRHYLKYSDRQDDEDHFIACIWNIVCCIWTCIHLPEMRDLPYVRDV